MRTKQEIKGQIDSLQKRRDALDKRRGEMRAEFEQVSAAIEDLTQKLNDAFLDGGDTSRDVDQLAKSRARVDVFRGAIAQADVKISELDQQLSDEKKALAFLDLHRLGTEAEALLSAAVNDLRACMDKLNATDAKFADMQPYAQKSGVSVDSDDHLRRVRGVVRYLLGDLGTGEGIAQKLAHVLESYGDLVTSKKGG